MSSAPAGWYDDGSGRQRWWDGLQWTDSYQDESIDRASPAGSKLAGTLTDKPDSDALPDTIWSAIGKPMTGVGGGRYRLTSDYLFFEKGMFSTKAQQIRTNEIHDVDAAQSLSQKARGVGNITLWAKRAGGDERVILEDVPAFREGVAALNDASNAARERLHLRNTTQHQNVVYSGATPAPVAAPATTARVDLNAELAKLAQFRASGVLDEEEFTAAKRRLLGL